MDAPLWTETHAPALSDIPQPSVREAFESAAEQSMNLVVYGPKGSGKTAAIRALARETHADPDNDFVELNVADFFGRTKKQIANDPRFTHFLAGRSDLAKRDMINHVLKESASYAPVSGDYKTILLDNAEGIREDFQQALRRVMERYYATTQFVIATRRPTKLIPPIRSRCFPIPVAAPTTNEIVGVLEPIADAEDVTYDADGLEFVAGYADGNLRKAILGAQTTAATEGEITMAAAYEVLGDIGVTDDVKAMLADAENGAFTDARRALDSLLVDDGMDGDEVLDAILSVSRSTYSGERLAQIHRLAGDIDFDATVGANDRIHLGRFLAEFPFVTK